MPRQGQSVESCIINKWYKQKGDKVAIGEILFSYETDKASFEEEAKAEGVILDVFYVEGDEVECLKTVCVIGAEGEEFIVASGEAQPGSLTPEEQPGLLTPEEALLALDNSILQDSASDTEVSNAEFRTPDPGFVRVSPRARILAEKTGADVRSAVPTGANGRIMERDIRKAISEGYVSTRAARREEPGVSGGPAISGSGIGGRVTAADVMQRRMSYATSADSELNQAKQADGFSASLPEKQGEVMQADSSASLPEYEDVALSNIRKVIAKSMHASLADSAQLTNHSSFDATDILNLRKNLKSFEGREDLGKITVTDIIVYAASRVLLKHRNLNAHFKGDKMTLFNNTHIGIAVDTPRGLLVPTVFNANKMSLTELSSHCKELFDKCKQKTITPDLLTGGSFTVSNLGGFGIEMFTPILNPPQTGLLGVCCVIERTRNGIPYPAMGLSLTYDHRAVDGADAARFQKELITYLERFTSELLLEGGV